MPEPSDLELWHCVETTLRTVLLPSITDEWARTAAVHLVGLAGHAATRPDDRTAERAAELSCVMDQLAENPLVRSEWPIVSCAPEAVLTAVSRVLVAAVDDDGPAGDAIRQQLRTVVVRHVDDDLAVTGRLLPYFRGVLDA